MKKPIHVLLLFGGQSAEHAVSIRSAQAILNNLSRDRYRISLAYIHLSGNWSFVPGQTIDEAKLAQLEPQAPLPWGRHQDRNALPLQTIRPDIVFPVLHGPNGEDGRLQGFLQMLGIPFVGCSAVGSMLAMDKGLSKSISQLAGLPIVDYMVFARGQAGIEMQILEQFSFPIFIKPCNMGSSVGISRVESAAELPKAIELAFSHDERLIAEQGIPVREIELSVMGRFPDIRVSQPGELIPHNEFYDYNDKYIDGLTDFALPARLTPELSAQARDLAARAYALHLLDGYARVDLFLHKENGQLYFNEINTIPGFTEISMFPKLWQLEDLPFSTLLDKLVDMALSRPAS